jgi:hypothetical protein
MFYSILRERVIVRARGGCWRIYFSVIFSIGVARVNGAQRELFMPLFFKRDWRAADFLSLFVCSDIKHRAFLPEAVDLKEAL